MLNIVGQKKIIKSKWQRHCHIPFKMAWKIKIKVKKNTHKNKISQKPDNNNFWQKCGRIRSQIHCYWESKMARTFWKVFCQFLTKPEIVFPCDLIIRFLGI